MLQKKNYFSLVPIIIIYFSFFLGFFFKNFSVGGAKSDFYAFTWKGIQLFKENLSNALINYGNLGDANFPFFYFFNAYLNPLSFDQKYYFLSSILIGFFTIFFFFKTLELVYGSEKNHKYIVFFSSSLIFLLPFYISRVFFGVSANLGWFFFIVTIFFFNKYRTFSKNNYLICTCLFSSLALYCRPALVFFPIFFSLYNLLIVKDLKKLLILFFSYLSLSLPGLILIYLWIENSEVRNIVTSPWNPSQQGGEFHYKSYLRNLICFGSYFLFYSIPLILLNFKNILLIVKEKKELLLVLVILFIGIFFYELLMPEILNSYKWGGGVFSKLNNFLFDESNILFIFFGSLGLYGIHILLKKTLHNLILLLCIFGVYGLSNFFYQDYFEPLLFFLFYSNIIQFKEDFFNKEKLSKINNIYFVYFFVYLALSLVYQNFYV